MRFIILSGLVLFVALSCNFQPAYSADEAAEKPDDKAAKNQGVKEEDVGKMGVGDGADKDAKKDGDGKKVGGGDGAGKDPKDKDAGKVGGGDGADKGKPDGSKAGGDGSKTSSGKGDNDSKTKVPSSVVVGADCTEVIGSCFAADSTDPNLKGKTFAKVTCDEIGKGQNCFTGQKGGKVCTADEYNKIKDYVCFCPRTVASVVLVAILCVFSMMVGKQ